MIIPAVMAYLRLGIAFDLATLNTKPYNIFDQEAINKSIVTINNTNTYSHYQYIESSDESTKMLNLDGEMALKVASGSFEGDLAAIGKYASDLIDRKNTIEVLIKVSHETLVETFPTYLPQNDDWRSKRPEQVGDHYIQGVVYGGLLVVSLQHVVKHEEDMEEIKAAITGSISKSGSFDAKAAGRFESIAKEMGDKIKTTIKMYATVGAIKPPTTYEQVLTLMREYPDRVRQVNGGKGAPVRIIIESLASLDDQYPAFVRNRDMDSVYSDADNKYEDMKMAQKEVRDLDRKYLWNDEQQEQIDSFRVRLGTAFKSMRSAISSMDTRNGVKPDHFDQAFKDYGDGPKNIPDRYMRELTNLTHHLLDIPFHWFPYTAATTHYIHWGSINCSLPSPDPVYVGYAASSPRGFGNGGDILCLDLEPDFESSKEYRGSSVSRLTGMTYVTPNQATGFAYCAFCRLENATTVEVIAGLNSCPPDMKLEYTGYLATNLRANSRPVCMAEQPDDSLVDLHAQKDSDAGKLVPLRTRCEDCEGEEEEEKQRYVSCAVCSR